jgi:hypothetical protein
VNIIEAIEDQGLLRRAFKDLSTWRAWMIYLKALFGLPMDAEDMKLFSECTGLTEAPGERVRESFVIAGRRSGKSFISAIIAVYLACFKDWTRYLSAGERGYIFIVAVDKMQAKIIKNYISGLLGSCQFLRRLIGVERAEEIELKNRVTITVKTCSFRTIRGYTLLAAILEELAFFRSEQFANPDREILAAVRPALATIPESLLIGISTPYSRSGVLWDQFKAGFGKAGGPLVWRAESLKMNPTLDRQVIEQALADDPAAARSEWQSEWREDIQAFLNIESIEAAVIPGRFELPPVKGISYVAFIDPSGGRVDSFVLAVGHREKSGKIVLDVLRERRPPFKPVGVVQEFADVLNEYHILSAKSDRYAGEWVTEAFEKEKVEIKNSELPASELYLELLPMIQNGSLELLDNKRLTAQLAGLERRTRSGGRDMITHYTGGHDDLAVAAAGAAYEAKAEDRDGAFIGFSKRSFFGDDDNRDDYSQIFTKDKLGLRKR